MPVAILECAVTSPLLGWRLLRVRLAEDPKAAFELDPVAFESPVNPDHVRASCGVQL